MKQQARYGKLTADQQRKIEAAKREFHQRADSLQRDVNSGRMTREQASRFLSNAADLRDRKIRAAKGLASAASKPKTLPSFRVVGGRVFKV